MKSVGWSIIIRTLNEETFLPQVIDALLNQKTELTVEIIIVDCGSTDRTLDIADKYYLKVVDISENTFTWGFALNIGIYEAKYEYVLLLSGHAIPQNRFFLSHYEHILKNEDVAGVYGKQNPVSGLDPFEDVELNYSFPDLEEKYSESDTFSNANGVIKKSIWMKTKYNESIMSAEDGEWVLRVKQKGYKIYYSTDAYVLHSHDKKNIVSVQTSQSMYLRIFWRSYVCTEILDGHNQENPSLKFFNLYKYNLKRSYKYLKNHQHNLFFIKSIFYEYIRTYAYISGMNNFVLDDERNSIKRMNTTKFSDVKIPLHIKLISHFT